MRSIFALLSLLVLMTPAWAQVTTTSPYGRAQIQWPDFGHQGGAALHTKLTNSVAEISNNLIGRWSQHTAIADAATVNIVHNFGLAISQLDIRIYESGVLLTQAQRDADYSLATVDTNTISVTNSSGGPKTFDVLLTAFRINEVENGLIVNGAFVTTSNATVERALPGWNLKSTNGVGAAAAGYVNWYDSANTQIGYIGFNSFSNTNMVWNNLLGGDLYIQNGAALAQFGTAGITLSKPVTFSGINTVATFGNGGTGSDDTYAIMDAGSGAGGEALFFFKHNSVNFARIGTAASNNLTLYTYSGKGDVVLQPEATTVATFNKDAITLSKPVTVNSGGTGTVYVGPTATGALYSYTGSALQIRTLTAGEPINLVVSGSAQASISDTAITLGKPVQLSPTTAALYGWLNRRVSSGTDDVLIHHEIQGVLDLSVGVDSSNNFVIGSAAGAPGSTVWTAKNIRIATDKDIILGNAKTGNTHEVWGSNLEARSDANTTTGLYVVNENAGASASSIISAGVTGGGDAFYRAAIGTSRSWAWGVDNSDGDSWKLSTVAGGTAIPGGPGNDTPIVVTTAGAVQLGLTPGGSQTNVVNGFIQNSTSDTRAKIHRIPVYNANSVATNLIKITIPADYCFVSARMDWANSRAPASGIGTSKVGQYWYSVSRNGSGTNVVLDSLTSLNSSTDTSTSGGGSSATSAATTIVRSGAEANNLPQGVYITFNPQTTSGSTGYITGVIEIMSLCASPITIENP